jgi:hypothetical protein
MTPAQFSKELRKISTKIDNSERPDKRRVVAAMRNLIAAIEADGAPVRPLGPSEYALYSLWPEGETERIVRVDFKQSGGEWVAKVLDSMMGPPLTPDMQISFSVPSDESGEPDFEYFHRTENDMTYQQYICNHMAMAYGKAGRTNADLSKVNFG